jgi:hypothetical protein
MSESEWWEELKKRKTNIKPNDYKKNDDDEFDDESFEEDRRFSSYINHGDAFWDGMINWFRK